MSPTGSDMAHKLGRFNTNRQTQDHQNDHSRLLDSLSDPVVMASMEDTILYANKAARKVLAGVGDGGDIVGANLQHILHPKHQLPPATEESDLSDEQIVRDRQNVVWKVRKQIAKFGGQEGFACHFRKITLQEQCLAAIYSTHPNPMVLIRLCENNEVATETVLNKAAEEHFPDFDLGYLPGIMDHVANMQKEGKHFHKDQLKEEWKDRFRYTDLDIVYLADQGAVMVYGSDVTDFVEMEEFPRFNPNPILRFGMHAEGISIDYYNPAANRDFPYLVQSHASMKRSPHSTRGFVSLPRIDREPPEIFRDLPQIIARLKKSDKKAFYTREISIQPPEGGEKHYEQKIAWDPANPRAGITYLSDITDRKKLIAELEYMRDVLKEETIRDPLTGLYNRRYLEAIVKKRIDEAMRHGDSFGLLIADIDHFKPYNDEHSHLAGDVVLKAVADTLEGSVRTHDIVCRYGGEEFVVVLPRTHLRGMEDVAEKLRRAIERQPKVIHHNVELPGITISIGGVSIALEGDPSKVNLENEMEHLIGVADKELQRAKRGGRNTVRVRMVGEYRHVSDRKSTGPSNDEGL